MSNDLKYYDSLLHKDSKGFKGFKKFIGSPKGKYTDMSEAQFKNSQKFGYKQK